MAMTASRLEEAVRNTTATARKVLDSVPRESPWTLDQIASDLVRRGIRLEKHVVHGCLRALTEDKIVREVSHCIYVRVEPKPITLVRSAKGETVLTTGIKEPAVTTPAEPQKALDKIVDLAVQLRAIASTLEEAVLEVQAEIEATEGKVTKLKQLQELLKGLS